MRRDPAFAAAALAGLSLGIAANTAVFSVVNKVLLEPLPYPHPEELVQLISDSPIGTQHVVSIPKYEIWRDMTVHFESMAAYDTTGPAVNLGEGAFPQPLAADRVSADYFAMFGAHMVIGRAFTDAEERAGPARVVISERLWRAHFHASPALIDSDIVLDGEPHRVMGVLASSFPAERPVDVWLPLEASKHLADHISRVRVTARRKKGATLALASADVALCMRWYQRRYPAAPVLYREQFRAIPLRDALVGDVRPALLLLAGAVGFVLLTACANTGSLVLARASRRTAEIALRAALGAERIQLVWQLFSESILIALAAGALGLLLGFAGIHGLLLLSPADMPRTGANGSAIAMDWRIFLFTLAVSAASAVLFGLLPALTASRADVMSLVKDTAAQSGMGFRRGGWRAVLVIAQVALAMMLLVGAALLLRTFAAQRSIEPGFDEAHVLTAQSALAGQQFEHADAVVGFVHSVESKLKRQPGIAAVASTSALPLEPAIEMPFTVAGRDQTMVGRYHGVAAWASVSAGYFDTLHIRALGGRLFTGEDDANSGPVVVINRAMMKKFWQEVDANPVGEFVIIGKGMGRGLEDVPRQIVGVVADIREAGFERRPMMYVPVSQVPDRLTARNSRVLPLTWVIRTAGDGVSAAAVEQGLREAAGGLALGRIRTMHEVVAASASRARFYLVTMTGFGILALILAAAGLYAVMAHTVRQRTREIGVRMALGARPDDLRNLVLWQGMRLALLGIAAGIPAALALTRIMVSLVLGLKPWDPEVFAAVSALLAATALAAAWSPTMRAAGVSPWESLRG